MEKVLPSLPANIRKTPAQKSKAVTWAGSAPGNSPQHLKTSPTAWMTGRYQNHLRHHLAGTYLKSWNTANTTREKPIRKTWLATPSKSERLMKNCVSGYGVSVMRRMLNSLKTMPDYLYACKT